LAQVKLETLKSVHILTMASTSQPMTCCPRKQGVAGVTWPPEILAKKWQYLKNATT